MKLLGVGYATEDIKPSSMKLKVHIYSVVNDVNGTPEGAEVECIWNSTQNRLTAPTVYKGETIHVYGIVGSDTLYWENVRYETDLRRMEVCTFGVSNKKKDDIDNSKGDNMHYMTWDAISQVIHLHTSNNRDELVGYDVSFNLKKGIFTFKDTKEIKITIDSDKKKFTANVEHFEFNCKTFNINASESVKIDTPDYTLDGGKSTINHDVTSNKSVTIIGKLSQKGTSNFTSAVKMNGNAKTNIVNKHSHVIL